MSQALWALLDSAPCGAALVDAQGRILELNPAAERIFGHRRADALGRDAAALLLGASAGTAPRAPGTAVEVTGVRADGQSYVVEAAVAAVQDAGPARAALYFRDLTRERAAETALSHLEAVAATVRDAMIETDPEFRVIGWNRAAETMYGWAPDEVLGRSASEVLRTQLSDVESEPMRSGLAEHGHVLTLAVQRTKAGARVEVEASVIELRDDAGELSGYVAINRDVSRRRRLEERLRDTRHLEVVGRLAGGVAHDLNSLLTAMLGYADLTLADRDLPPRVRPDIQQIVRAAERAGTLTRQLLALSRQQVLTPRLVDVNEIVSASVAARRRLAGRRVDLVDRPADGLAPVMIDPARLEQALLDVVTNAGEAMPEGGRLTIESRMVESDGESRHIPPGRYVSLSVADTGAGMDAETRARAFEPFFTTKCGHTGLGLSTLYGFVGQSGGHVTLDSEPGAGTTVTLYFAPD